MHMYLYTHSSYMALIETQVTHYAVIQFARASNGMVTYPLGLGLAIEDKPTKFSCNIRVDLALTLDGIASLYKYCHNSTPWGPVQTSTPLKFLSSQISWWIFGRDKRSYQLANVFPWYTKMYQLSPYKCRY